MNNVTHIVLEQTAVGALSLVLAHKDEQQSTSAQSKYSMAFTLEDAVTGPRGEKRVHFGSIPGESASASLVSLASALSSQSEPVAPTTVSSSSSSDSGKEVESDDNSVTSTTVTASTTVKNDTSSNNNKDSPVNSHILSGDGSIVISSSGASSDDDEKDDSADQRIVFIERLMGLHFASPSSESSSEVNSESNDDSSVDQKKKVPSVKWTSRIRKLSPSSTSPIDISSSSSFSSSIEQPESIQMQAHPMLRYAAAAMMSRLIAAAARAQMENQAKEQQSLTFVAASRGGAKDKDDDAEEESVPVLLASLRDGPSDNSLRPRSSHMYGRPMARTSSRGPLFTASSSSSSPVTVNRFAPSYQRNVDSIHPLIQHLQALQALSSLQRLQRQREMSSQMETVVNRQGDRALVMLAVPIAPQETRPNVVITNAYGPGISPFTRASQYYGHSGEHQSPYAASYSVPIGAAYPRPMVSHSVAVHPAIASGSYYGQYHGRPGGHYLPPPPAAGSGASAHSPVGASSPHYTSYHHPASHPVSGRVGQPLHSAYSHVRPVVEVPIEVPVEVPVHVPVPVTAYSAPTIVGHPAIHAIASQAAALAGHRGPIEHDTSDTATSDSSDQIVLLYDAELHPDSDNDNSNNNNNHNNGNTGSFGSNQNADDLQSSASEAKPMNNKLHHFLSTSSLPSNPSYHKMKLFHEMMSQKHASQPGVRYLPIALQSSEQSNNPLPQQSMSSVSSHPLHFTRNTFDSQHQQQQQISHEMPSHQQQQQQLPQQMMSHSQIPPTQQSPSHQQAAFIVISADEQQPQQQQQQHRDQSTLQPVVVERR